MESVNQVSGYVNKTLNFINNNKVLSSVLAMFLVLYAAMAAPKLPKNVVKVFDNTLFKLGYMFLMAYIASKDPSVAIISAAALLITIQTLSSYEAASQVASVAQVTPPKPNVEVPKSVALSPVIAEIVDVSTKKAEAYRDAAIAAIQQGDNSTALVNNERANREDAKVNSAIKVEEHTMAAQQAQVNGDVDTAKVHQTEATKHDLIVTALNKADMHLENAAKAQQQGDTATSNMQMDRADKHEMIAQSLIKAVEHSEAAVMATKSGDEAAAKANGDLAAKHEAKAVSLIKADEALIASAMAEQAGNVQEAAAMKQVAVVEETKMALITKMEAKMEEAKVAHENGQVEKAMKLMDKASKIENKLGALCGTTAGMLNMQNMPTMPTMPGPVDGDTYASVIPETETESELMPVPTMPKTMPEMMPNMNMQMDNYSGYEPDNYANF